MLLLLLLLGLTACELAPLAVIAGGAYVGHAIAKRTGPEGIISEIRLKSEIHETWSKNNLPKLPILVNGNRVMICGYYDGDAQKHKDVITRKDVKIIDATSKTKIGEEHFIEDKLLKMKVKSILLANPLTQSRNYDLNVIDGVVYLLAVAYNQQEKEEIIDTINGVKDVRHFEYDIEIKKGSDNFLNRKKD